MTDGAESDNYGEFLDAIRRQDEQAVEELLRRGICLKRDTGDARVVCPLELAVGLENLALVRVLLRHGACVSARVRARNRTALHYAAITRQRGLLLELLRQGVDWQAADDAGAGALHMAFELGAVDFERRGGLLRRRAAGAALLERKVLGVLEPLLALGADANARTAAGETPLRLALRQGMLAAAELLLARGAGADVRDHDGDAPLHLLIEDAGRARAPEVEARVAWLLARGASASLVNARGLTPVQLAARHRLRGALRALLERAEVGYANGRGEGWLHILLSTRDEWAAAWRASLRPGELDELCERLVERGVPVDRPDCYGSTALHVAALQRRARLVRAVLDRFEAVAACDGLGRSALHLVVDRCLDERGRGLAGYDEVVRALLAKGADPGRPSRDGATPVALAARRRQLRMLWIFKEHAADFAQTSAGGEGLLHAVAKSRARPRDALADKMVVEMLISQGCEVDAPSRSGHSPLHLACLYGNARVAESLLRHGARPDAREALMGWAPLHLAAGARVLEALARGPRGLDLELADRQGRTALHLAAARGRPELAARLLALGASARARDAGRERLTPLHLAAQRGDERLAALLLAADPAAAGLAAARSGATALHMAVEAGCAGLVRRLVRLGADVEQRDARERSSALHLAVRAGRAGLVDLLVLGCGADMDARQAFGEAPLHVAAKYFRRDGAAVAGRLLRAGARVDATNAQGRTPLQYAIEYKCAEGVRLLLQFGADLDQALAAPGLLDGADMARRVVEHLVCLQALGLEQSLDQCRVSLDKCARQFGRLRDDCRREVDLLRGQALHGSHGPSLYDLLHMSPRRRFACLGGAADFSPARLETQFPSYYGLLWRVYHEARERRCLLASALDAWYLITGVDLPSICVDHVLDFLDDRSLKSMLEAAEAIELEEIC
ncbi:ankyrin-3-like [Phymastichus coffea]|uniref:ankyrin-3-like n=1 Tax=Phymastichus coffea TaxID=108790 RepID=UPI00273B56A6|nr:ankyrin-3-like [Phymastichus coffea]